MTSPVIARLAPSPTGQLHLGNIRTFMWAWLSARAQGGRVIMRIEDLDSPRIKAGVAEKMLGDLKWLGFEWDEGPGATEKGQFQGSVDGNGAVLDPLTPDSLRSSRPSPPQGERGLRSYVQTERREFYRGVFERLLKLGAIYPCVCTRGDIAAAQSAPHAGEHELRYPGTCRGRFSEKEIAAFAAGGLGANGRAPAWRLKVEPEEIAFEDLLLGRCVANPYAEVGDFIVAKGPDNPAYQLAVVADDIDMKVNEVVRGDDLVPSTARQLLLYRLLGGTPPRYGHAPLIVGPDGMRLAKRHGEARVAEYRSRGMTAERMVGVLGRWSGLEVRGDCALRDLIPLWGWERVRRERVVLTAGMLGELG